MRELKFRAWDKESKKWARELPFMVITFTDADALFELTDERLVWVQYTGLKDKNGKEIYEGDVVSYKNCTGSMKVKPVEYEAEYTTGFYPLVVCGSCGDPLADEIEVIGNIYENPELIEK